MTLTASLYGTARGIELGYFYMQYVWFAVILKKGKKNFGIHISLSNELLTKSCGVVFLIFVEPNTAPPMVVIKIHRIVEEVKQWMISLLFHYQAIDVQYMRL